MGKSIKEQMKDAPQYRKLSYQEFRDMIYGILVSKQRKEAKEKKVIAS